MRKTTGRLIWVTFVSLMAAFVTPMVVIFETFVGINRYWLTQLTLIVTAVATFLELSWQRWARRK